MAEPSARRRPGGTADLTPPEMVLLGLKPGARLPKEGLTIPAVYFTGSGSSKRRAQQLAAWLHVALAEGSFNLRLREPIALEAPQSLELDCEDWQAVPVVLNESAVGVHAWRRERHDGTFLEVFAPVRLAEVLGATRGDVVSVRLLPGHRLCRAA
jgi:hypothetical protein